MNLDGLRRAQSDVVTRAQLALCGFDRHAVRTHVRARRWQKFGGVVICHNAELTADQRLWAAVLDQSQPCALAGVTALVMAGLRTRSGDEIHVIVPHGTRPRPRPGVRIHQSRQPLRAIGQPPFVRPAFAVVQAGMWEAGERRAAGLFLAAFQQEIVTVPSVEEALDAAPRHPRVQPMRRLLLEVVNGADSLAEVEFLRLAERAGLPPPVRQARRRIGANRYRLDFDFGRFAVEVDGPLHWQDVDAELARQNAIMRSGQPLLRFTTTAIRYEPESVVRELRASWAAHR